MMTNSFANKCLTKENDENEQQVEGRTKTITHAEAAESMHSMRLEWLE